MGGRLEVGTADGTFADCGQSPQRGREAREGARGGAGTWLRRAASIPPGPGLRTQPMAYCVLLHACINSIIQLAGVEVKRFSERILIFLGWICRKKLKSCSPNAGKVALHQVCGFFASPGVRYSEPLGYPRGSEYLTPGLAHKWGKV